MVVANSFLCSPSFVFLCLDSGWCSLSFHCLVAITLEMNLMFLLRLLEPCALHVLTPWVAEIDNLCSNRREVSCWHALWRAQAVGASLYSAHPHTDLTGECFTLLSLWCVQTLHNMRQHEFHILSVQICWSVWFEHRRKEGNVSIQLWLLELHATTTHALLFGKFWPHMTRLWWISIGFNGHSSYKPIYILISPLVLIHTRKDGYIKGDPLSIMVPWWCKLCSKVPPALQELESYSKAFLLSISKSGFCQNPLSVIDTLSSLRKKMTRKMMTSHWRQGFPCNYSCMSSFWLVPVTSDLITLPILCHLKGPIVSLNKIDARPHLLNRAGIGPNFVSLRLALSRFPSFEAANSSSLTSSKQFRSSWMCWCTGPAGGGVKKLLTVFASCCKMHKHLFRWPSIAVCHYKPSKMYALHTQDRLVNTFDVGNCHEFI